MTGSLLCARRCRFRGLVAGSVPAAVVILASAAWACLPGPQPIGEGYADDQRTLLQSCTAPSGSTRPCKAMLDTPPFPNADSVKGPAGSKVVAFVVAGLEAGMYDLVFADKTKVASGALCHDAPLTVLAGPVATNVNRGINNTLGVIPEAAQLGGGQLCFAGRAKGASLPARFKVVV